MGAVVDINNMMDVNAVAYRVLSDALGDDGTQAFIGQFRGNNARNGRPRLMASQIADALERGKAKAAAASASVNGGSGDFTVDRHKRSARSFEEVTERIMKTDAAERARRGLAAV